MNLNSAKAVWHGGLSSSLPALPRQGGMAGGDRPRSRSRSRSAAVDEPGSPSQALATTSNELAVAEQRQRIADSLGRCVTEANRYHVRCLEWSYLGNADVHRESRAERQAYALMCLVESLQMLVNTLPAPAEQQERRD